MRQLPGFLLGLWALAIFWLAGNKSRAAWMMGMVGQIWWVIYAVWLNQLGLLISCALYFTIYLRNWRKWSGPEPTVEALQAELAACRKAQARP